LESQTLLPARRRHRHPGRAARSIENRECPKPASPTLEALKPLVTAAGAEDLVHRLGSMQSQASTTRVLLFEQLDRSIPVPFRSPQARPPLRDRKFADSLLEGRVRSEPVSEIGLFRAILDGNKLVLAPKIAKNRNPGA
jgi:hypothetical protein